MVELSKAGVMTVGLDLGDRFSYFVVLSAEGCVLEEGRVPSTPAALARRFSGQSSMRIAMETGSLSPWVSRQLASYGHEVLVANSRKLRLIYENATKDDRVDARYLARLAHFEPALLSPVQHRGPTAQEDLALLRSRDTLVAARTMLVNHVRGLSKSFGLRLPACATSCFSKLAASRIPANLQPTLAPVLEEIASLTRHIKSINKDAELLAQSRYPETNSLRQVNGIGSITSLTFVLTLDQAQRFPSSRTVGAFLGLVPARAQSGRSDPPRRITKRGDSQMRRLLVNAAHYILGPFGRDCDLRRFGLRICARAGKLAKKKAVVAVARKLAVLLHRLWISGQPYEPFRHSSSRTAAA